MVQQVVYGRGGVGMNLLIRFALSLFVSFPALGQERIEFPALDGSMNVSGELFLPQGASGKVPAMVVVHGTGGVDDRTRFFAKELPKQGIAAFVVDFKKGVFTSPTDRPRNAAFRPAAYAALRILRTRPEIDPARIGIMGFSLGGHLTLTTSLVENQTRWIGTEPGFRVHVAYYPGCRFFIPQLTAASKIEAPLLAFWGTLDSYGDGEYCPKLKDALTSVAKQELDLVAYENAHHGFDGSYNGSYNDPAAINGRGRSTPDPAYAAKARLHTVDFLKRHLK